MRAPRTRARSTDTPRGSPGAGSRVARIGLPKLIAARSLPLGASSVTGCADTTAHTSIATHVVTIRNMGVIIARIVQSPNGGLESHTLCRGARRMNATAPIHRAEV